MLIQKKVELTKIEDVLWEWKKRKDEEARFFKNMYNEILEVCNRLDNEQVPNLSFKLFYDSLILRNSSRIQRSAQTMRAQAN